MDTLNKVFDITPNTKEAITTIPLAAKSLTPENNNDEAAILNDMQISAEDLKEIIEMGKSALVNVLEIAELGQHPRFFEAAALLIKSINEANRERMELHLKLSQIRKNMSEIRGGTPINVDKGIFVGTSADLLNIIKPRKTLTVENNDDS